MLPPETGRKNPASKEERIQEKKDHVVLETIPAPEREKKGEATVREPSPGQFPGDNTFRQAGEGGSKKKEECPRHAEGILRTQKKARMSRA